MEEEYLDVVGIGALNLDYFVSKSHLPHQLQVSIRNTLENQSERFISMGQVQDFINNAGRNNCKIMYGGSAFNTIQTIISLGLGLKIGFVGVAGGEADGYDFWKHIEQLKINKKFCFHVPMTQSGKCFAVVDGNDRKLLTAEGANYLLPTYIAGTTEGPNEKTIIEPFVRYLQLSKWLHLTSFISRSTLSFISRHVKEAKRRNPGLKVSFDPGDDYTQNISEEVLEFARLSDYIFLSWREFKQLAATTHGRIIKQSAKKIYENLSMHTQVIVLKGRASNYVIQNIPNEEIYIRRYWHKFVPQIFIKDDVGAGDVFTGGFIAGYLVPMFEGFGRGPTKLGSALVCAKLKERGSSGYQKFSDLAKKQAQSTLIGEETNIRDLIHLYLPPIVRYLLAILVGIIITLITQWLTGFLSIP